MTGTRGQLREQEGLVLSSMERHVVSTLLVYDVFRFDFSIYAAVGSSWFLGRGRRFLSRANPGRSYGIGILSGHRTVTDGRWMSGPVSVGVHLSGWLT